MGSNGLSSTEGGVGVSVQLHRVACGPLSPPSAPSSMSYVKDRDCHQHGGLLFRVSAES